MNNNIVNTSGPDPVESKPMWGPCCTCGQGTGRKSFCGHYCCSDCLVFPFGNGSRFLCPRTCQCECRTQPRMYVQTQRQPGAHPCPNLEAELDDPSADLKPYEGPCCTCGEITNRGTFCGHWCCPMHSTYNLDSHCLTKRRGDTWLCECCQCDCRTQRPLRPRVEEPEDEHCASFMQRNDEAPKAAHAALQGDHSSKRKYSLNVGEV